MSGDNLDDLEKRLQDARQEYNEEYNPSPSEEGKNMSVGARAGIELVGALLGGTLLGWMLDKWFGTAPILLLVFMLLGVVVGFYNIYKITNNIGTSVGFRELQDRQKQGKQPPENKNY